MMMTINLLPWRTTAAIKQQRQCYCRLISSLLLSLIGITVIYYLSHLAAQRLQQTTTHWQQLLHQQQPLLQQVRQLQQQQQQLQAKISQLQLLTQQRDTTLHYLISITKTLPADTQLTHLQQQDQQLILSGKTANNHSLALLLEQLRQAAILPQSKLLNLTTELMNEQAELNFTLRFNLLEDNLAS